MVCVYRQRRTGGHPGPCVSWRALPPSRACDLFSCRWLCSTAHLFYQHDPELSKLKSVIRCYPSFTETHTQRQFLVCLKDRLRSFFHGKLCWLLWCLLYENPPALVYRQHADHFPLLLDYHLVTWRRLVLHLNTISVRSANRKPEDSFIRKCISSVWYWWLGDVCQLSNTSWSLPWEGWNQLWTVTLVHALGVVTLQMLKRVILGKRRKWKRVLILSHGVWSLWPEGPCVLLLTMWCWHSSTLRTSAASWLPCVLLDYFDAFPELLKVVAHTLQILQDYLKCLFNQLTLW